MNTIGKARKVAAMARGSLRWALSRVGKPDSERAGLRTVLSRLTALSLDYVEISVTKACSLRCAACRHLMPYYDRPRNYDIANILRDADSLLQAVGHIAMLRVLGGEPLLHRHLDRLLLFLGDSGKIGSIRLVTNGTILPRPAVLRALKAVNGVLDISDYGAVSVQLQPLVALLERESIAYEIVRQPWLEFGRPVSRQYTKNQLSQLFLKCTSMPHKCLIVSNGEFHLCARSANATELGLVQRRKQDYVDLVNTPRHRIAAEIRQLVLFSDYLEACRTCEQDFRPTATASQGSAGLSADASMEFAMDRTRVGTDLGWQPDSTPDRMTTGRFAESPDNMKVADVTAPLTRRSDVIP